MRSEVDGTVWELGLTLDPGKRPEVGRSPAHWLYRGRVQLRSRDGLSVSPQRSRITRHDTKGVAFEVRHTMAPDTDPGDVGLWLRFPRTIEIVDVPLELFGVDVPSDGPGEEKRKE